jgi:hypothetical protein
VVIDVIEGRQVEAHERLHRAGMVPYCLAMYRQSMTDYGAPLVASEAPTPMPTG